MSSEDREGMSSAALLRSDDALDIAELQWRLAAPAAIFVLTLLAVPLARSSPREGRYGRLALAVLVYIVFANLLGVARVWVERGVVGAWPGLWWVHALFVVVALAMLWRQEVAYVFRRRRVRVS